MNFIKSTFKTIATVALGSVAAYTLLAAPAVQPMKLCSFQWNDELVGVDYTRFDLGLTSAADQAGTIDRSCDIVAMQETFNNTDVANFIDVVKDDYPYYYRPDADEYRPALCQPESQGLLVNIFECLVEKQIATLDFNSIAPCIDKFQDVVDADFDCLKCFITQAYMNQIKYQRLNYNAFFPDPPIEGPSVDQVVFGRCFDPTFPNLDQNIFERQAGLMLIAKEPISFYNGTVMPIGTVQGLSQDIDQGLVIHSGEDVMDHRNSFVIHRAVLSFSYKGMRGMTTHLPFRFGLDTPEESALDIITDAMNKKVYDFMLGNFNSGENYAPDAYEEILERGYLDVKKLGRNLPLVYNSPIPWLKYGTIFPRGIASCHNSRLLYCKELPMDSWMLDTDHIWLNPSSWKFPNLSVLSYFAFAGNQQLSDHIGIRTNAFSL